MAVENQRRIIIRHPRDEINFIQVSKENLQLASRTLTPAQTIIYMDLCGNADGYVKDYSPAYYKTYYGISKDTSQKAFHELEKVSTHPILGLEEWQETLPHSPKKD